eukprot:5074683-Alexandrium_andersonii.AAC.1
MRGPRSEREGLGRGLWRIEARVYWGEMGPRPAGNEREGIMRAMVFSTCSGAMQLGPRLCER